MTHYDNFEEGKYNTEETVNVEIDQMENISSTTNLDSTFTSGSATMIAIDPHDLLLKESTMKTDLELTVERLEAQLALQEERTSRLELALQKTLEIAVRGEQRHELVVTSILQKIFANLTNVLTDSLVSMQQVVTQTMDNYRIVPVEAPGDATSETLRVTRTDEGFTYTKVIEPTENIEDLKFFDKYFNDHPELFDSDGVVLVNILVAKEK